LVVNWERLTNNDFLLVSQFSVTGALYTCRPDLVGFVNGLPLVVIELKKLGVPARAAFDENLTHYKAEIPQLFWFNALLIASSGTDSRVGSLTADWERFFEVRAGLMFNASSARTSRTGCRWRDAARDVQDTGLPRAYGKPLNERKASALFAPDFENYPQRDVGRFQSPPGQNVQGRWHRTR
jgi:hypothetical protein